LTGGGAEGTTPLEVALSTLTKAQRQAVEAPGSALCVLAGAGSGKTRVLTLRVARRIHDGTAEADHTVVCTFTRKAALELRGRLRRLGVTVAAPATTGGSPGPGVRAGTLHQLALTLLRRHALDAGEAPPRVAESRYRLLTGMVGDPAIASTLDTEIGWAKARCLTAGSYPATATAAGRHPSLPLEEVAAHFHSYQARLAQRHSLDLDDVLVDAADLIHHDAGFAEGVHWRYRHLSVDEFQDINPAQFRLIEALMGSRNDLLAVGDPNQAIYGWNGSDPGLLRRLPALVPGMEVVRLEENHRSTPQVVAAAAAALGGGIDGTPRSGGPVGPLPVVTAYDDETAEAEGVASHLSQSAGGGRRWADHAVLARTNDQLVAVRSALSRAGIPFRLEPGPEAPWRPGGPGEPADAVELATFHRAKGLEWTWVSVVGIEDGYVPIVHATTTDTIAEERRLLYVALTRAAEELHCSWARSRRSAGGRRNDRSPSPWLAAVARVSRTGTGRVNPLDAGQRIAQLRAGLTKN
jgi:DNA helicase II / ATP-dependent DNA helicase PcrA